MQRDEYLKLVEKQIDGVLENTRFLSEIAQIRAKATLTQVTNQQLPIEFKFDRTFILSYARFLLSSSNYFSSLEKPDDAIKKKMLFATKTAAEAFEFIYHLSDSEEKEKALLNACMANHAAGYQANAIFLARKLKNQIAQPKDNFYAKLLYSNLQQTLIFYLERSIPNLIVQTDDTIYKLKKAQNELINWVKEKGDIIDIYDYSSQMGIHRAINDFALYTLNGNSILLESSLNELRNISKLTDEIGDFELNFLVSNLISGLELFRERSTWENIRANSHDKAFDLRWKLYLRNLALGTLRSNTQSNSIVEFWTSQIQALEKGLLSSSHGFVVQMPTSAGKTKVAELAILCELIKKPGFKCIYLAPFRALAYEIEEALSSVFSYIGYRVSSVVGGFDSGELENHLMQTSDVIVTTPEKIDLLFRSQPEFFEEIALIVVDEGHIIEQLERGPKLELLLTRLKRKIAHTGGRFLFISAVIPEINAKEFAQWLAGGEENVLSTGWRPTRQLLGIFTWRREGGFVFYPELKIGDEKIAFIPNIIARGRKSTKAKGKKSTRDPDKKVTAAKLAMAFVNQGPVLVFCGQTRFAKGVAKQLMTELGDTDSHIGQILPDYKNGDLTSLEVAKEWLGEENELMRYLRRGIAIHYGSMPEVLRRTIETEFKSGKLKILIATNTLGQGVNLPIKTVIIHSLILGHSEITGPNYIKVRDFWNICGRAGRALKDTEGQIIFISLDPKDIESFNKYTNMNNIESVKGSLYELLKDLIQTQFTDDELTENFSERLIDTHLLSMLVEESVDTPNEKILKDFLNDSLVKVQAITEGLDIEPLIKASTTVVHKIYNETKDENLRKIFSRTGLSIKSCKILSSRIQDNIGIFVDFCKGNGKQEFVLKFIIDNLQDLNEMIGKEISYKDKFDDNDLISGWINLMSIPALATEFTNENEIEKVAEYIDTKFVYKLSWGANAFTQILAYNMGMELKDLPLFLKELSSMIKFGVNSQYASWAMSLGINSRNLAYRIGTKFKEEVGETDFNKFIEWFKQLNTDKLGVLGTLESKALDSRVSKLEVNNISENDMILTKIKKDGLIVGIKGLSYEDRLKNLEILEDGQSLYLKRDYLNKYDVDAIKIYSNAKELGFIPREFAKVLAPQMDFGLDFKATLQSKINKNIKIEWLPT